MLKFDDQDFEIVDNSEEYVNFEEQRDYDFLQDIKDDIENEVDYKRYKDSFIHQYALAAKRDMVLGNGRYNVAIKKGDIVLKGNHELFYGPSDSYFENSYFSDKIIINLRYGEKFKFEAKNSIVLPSKEDFETIAISPTNSYIIKDSNIFYDVSGAPSNEYDVYINTIMINESNIDGCDLILNQDIDLYGPWFGSSFNLRNIKNDNADKLNPKSLPEYYFSAFVDIVSEDVVLSPKSQIIFSPYILDDDGLQMYTIKNMKYDNRSQDGKRILSFASDNCEINGVSIISDIDSVLIRSEEISILGQKEEAPTLRFSNEEGEYHKKTFEWDIYDFKIKMGKGSKLDILRNTKDITSEDGVFIFEGNSQTSTILSTSSLYNIDEIYLKNNDKNEMKIENSHFFFRKNEECKTLNISDSSVIDSTIVFNDNDIFLEGSKIIDSQLFSVSNKNKAKLDISNINLTLERNDFGSKNSLNLPHIKIEGEGRGKSHLTLENNTFSTKSDLDVKIGKDIYNVNNSSFYGTNRVTEVKNISQSTVKDSSLKDVKEVLNSNIESCNLSCLETIENIQLKDEEIAFNVQKDGHLRGNILDNPITFKESIPQSGKNITLNKSESIDF